MKRHHYFIAIACAVVVVVAGRAHAERDHLTGYKVKDLDKFKASGSYNLVDEGTTLDCEPKKAAFVLLPSEKDGGDDFRAGEATRYVCYKAKCAGALPPDVQVDDQLAVHTLEAKKAQIVCAPVKPPCTGVTVGGSCWLLGSSGDSCDTTCNNAGLLYDDATRTYAGSDGSDADCTAVLDALAVTGSGVTFSGCGVGVGCGYDNGGSGRLRCSDATTSSASFSTFDRACACQ